MTVKHKADLDDGARQLANAGDLQKSVRQGVERIDEEASPLRHVLVKVCLKDNFGVKLLTRKGTVSRDIDLEF
jgi:hypothetical protein